MVTNSPNESAWDETLKDSEALDSLMALAAGMSDLGTNLGARFQVHVIVDTNILVGDFLAILRKQRVGRRRPAVMELFAKRVLIGYFPYEKLGEVAEKCIEVSVRYKIALPEILTLWEKYQKLLTIVPTRDLEQGRSDTIALARRDPTDVPFVQARHIVGASAVLTNDQDLEACGVPVMPWSEVLLDLRTHARHQGLKVALLMAGGTAVVVPLSALIGCAKLVREAAIRIPRQAFLLVAVGLGIALLIPRSRKFLIDAGRAAFEGAKMIGTAVTPFLAQAMKAGTRAGERSRQMEPSLEKSLARVLSNRVTLTQAVYRVCLLAGEPLTVAEIWRGAERAGARSTAKNPARVVLVALKRHPLVEMLPDGRWQARSWGSDLQSLTCPPPAIPA